MLGQPRNNIARVHAYGTLDNNFKANVAGNPNFQS
jgi:hypothetical protein